MKIRMPDDRVPVSILCNHYPFVSLHPSFSIILHFKDEEITPESVTLEQYLSAAVENKPKSIQKYIDLGGNVNSIDEVSFYTLMTLNDIFVMLF